jgi:hypothetical protein
LITDLQAKLIQYKKREKGMRDELDREKSAHLQTKAKAEVLVKRIKELSAFQCTMKSYF